MSEVFKGRDPNGQTVAVKILQETNPYLVTKFVQEGNKVGPLLRGHPNIVYVHKFGQSQDSRLYLVMEYIDAPALRKIMQRPLTEDEIVQLIGQTCSALAFAHENNIVHRDIKPENILVTADGRIKVLDFGIAKLTSASTVTRDKIVGTPEYISPEQARGDPVRPASDVYSLGVVLYEMLAGSVPFRRPRDGNPYLAAMEVIRQHLKERPEPIRKRKPNAQVPKKLEKVTMRALKKDLKDRYETAKEMGQALGYKQVTDSHPALVKPSSAGLVVLRGARCGQRIALGEQELTLGRLSLYSSNTAISRNHAKIVFKGTSYWLEDLSKNGTWVDRQRVYGEIPLRSGSIITIGDNVLRMDQD
jgi:serine/threonine-protein kinase